MNKHVSLTDQGAALAAANDNIESLKKQIAGMQLIEQAQCAADEVYDEGIDADQVEREIHDIATSLYIQLGDLDAAQSEMKKRHAADAVQAMATKEEVA